MSFRDGQGAGVVYAAGEDVGAVFVGGGGGGWSLDGDCWHLFFGGWMGCGGGDVEFEMGGFVLLYYYVLL